MVFIDNEITKEQYEHYTKMPQSRLNEEVRQQLPPEWIEVGWYGCSPYCVDGKCFLRHRLEK